MAVVADASRDALVILEANRDRLDRLCEVLEREELDRVDVTYVVEVERSRAIGSSGRGSSLYAGSLAAARDC